MSQSILPYKLNENQLEDIVRNAIRVLETIGISIDHEKTIDRLTSFNGITMKDQRIYFTESICRQYLEKFRQEELDDPFPDSFTLMGPVYAPYIYSYERPGFRKPDQDDLVRVLRLCEALDIIRSSCPVSYEDETKDLAPLTTWKLALENGSRIGGGIITTVEQGNILYDMFQAVGRPGPGWLVEVSNSPLRLDSEALEIFLTFLDKDDFIEADPAPMLSAGMSGPIYVPAILIQGLAEWLGAYIVIKLLSDGRQGNSHYFRYLFGSGILLEPMHTNMQTVTVAYGSADSTLLRALARQLYRYVGGDPKIGGAFRTMANAINPQCVAERSLSVMMEALDGARLFVAAGMFALDLAYSPELMIIDREIMQYTEHVIRGVPVDKDFDQCLKTISDGVQAGTYLMHETTAAKVRDAWYPALFTHIPASESIRQEDSLLRRAHAQIEEVLNNYDFELEASKQRELDKVYNSAKKILC